MKVMYELSIFSPQSLLYANMSECKCYETSVFILSMRIFSLVYLVGDLLKTFLFFINNKIISMIRIMTVPIKSKDYESKHTFCLDKKMTTYICMSKSRLCHFVSIYFPSISNKSDCVLLKSDIY